MPNKDGEEGVYMKVVAGIDIGGTKCGAMFGEAVVITAAALKRRFKAYMKQNGAVLAKGWLLGLQFATLLENGEYFSITKRADEHSSVG